MLGLWYVVQYYATSEEEVTYKCMRAILSMPTEGMEVEMNVTYSFLDDPDNDILSGNITWRIPDPSQPAHWIHEEDTCKHKIGDNNDSIFLFWIYFYILRISLDYSFFFFVTNKNDF